MESTLIFIGWIVVVILTVMLIQAFVLAPMPEEDGYLGELEGDEL